MGVSAEEGVWWTAADAPGRGRGECICSCVPWATGCGDMASQRLEFRGCGGPGGREGARSSRWHLIVKGPGHG